MSNDEDFDARAIDRENFRAWLLAEDGRHGELIAFLQSLPPGELPTSFKPESLAPVLIAHAAPLPLLRTLGTLWGKYVSLITTKPKPALGEYFSRV